MDGYVHPESPGGTSGEDSGHHDQPFPIVSRGTSGSESPGLPFSFMEEDPDAVPFVEDSGSGFVSGVPLFGNPSSEGEFPLIGRDVILVSEIANLLFDSIGEPSVEPEATPIESGSVPIEPESVEPEADNSVEDSHTLMESESLPESESVEPEANVDPVSINSVEDSHTPMELESIPAETEVTPPLQVVPSVESILVVEESASPMESESVPVSSVEPEAALIESESAPIEPESARPETITESGSVPLHVVQSILVVEEFPAPLESESVPVSSGEPEAVPIESGSAPLEPESIRPETTAESESVPLESGFISDSSGGFVTGSEIIRPVIPIVEPEASPNESGSIPVEPESFQAVQSVESVPIPPIPVAVESVSIESDVESVRPAVESEIPRDPVSSEIIPAPISFEYVPPVAPIFESGASQEPVQSEGSMPVASNSVGSEAIVGFPPVGDSLCIDPLVESDSFIVPPPAGFEDPLDLSFRASGSGDDSVSVSSPFS